MFIRPDAPAGPAVDTAFVVSTTFDPVPANDSDSFTTTVALSADLAIEKTVSNPTPVAGGEFQYIPCLNDQHEWIAALAAIAEQHMAGWPTQAAIDPHEMSAQVERARQLGARA